MEVPQIQMLPLESIQPNPLNDEIYIDRGIDDDMLADIGSRGVTNPIVALANGLILRGHRRYQHAIEAGHEYVPVIYDLNIDPDDEVRVKAEIALDNQQARERTTEEKLREQEAIEAYLRREAGQNGQKVHDSQIKDESAKRAGLGSKRTLERAEETKKLIGELVEAGMEDAAQEVRDLMSSNVTGALRLARQYKAAKSKRDRDQKRQAAAASNSHRHVPVEEEVENVSVLDAWGWEVPESLVPVFTEAVPAIDAVRKIIRDAKKAVKEIPEKYGELSGVPAFADVDSLLQQAHYALVKSTPKYVCPECHGEGCDRCSKRGFQTDASLKVSGISDEKIDMLSQGPK